MINIIFNCLDCLHYNQQNLGAVNSDALKQTEFDSFSEAHKHMIMNPDHYMDITIEENEEE